MNKEIKEGKAKLLEEDCSEFAKTGVAQTLGSISPKYLKREDPDHELINPFVAAYFTHNSTFANAALTHKLPEPLVVALMTYHPQTIKACKISGPLSSNTTMEDIECAARRMKEEITKNGNNDNALRNMTNLEGAAKETYVSEIKKRTIAWNKQPRLRQR